MSSNVSGAFIGMLIVSCVPVYFALQIWLPLAWKGRWRWAALAPLIIAVPLIAYSLVALYHDSNLWPITIVLASPILVLYLGAVALARAFA